jgi:GH25 family lysozyme M1 (1,4-beta-N-acetylmuramidase)
MRAHGIDLNWYEQYYSRKEFPPRPVDFAIQQITQGDYRDSAYSIIKDGIRSVPIKGAYHYQRGYCAWKVQADNFLSQADGYDFLALDVEKKYNCKGLAALQIPMDGYVDGILPTMEYLTKYSGGRKVLLYTNPDTWGTWLRPYWKDLVKYDLWVARYQRTPNPEAVADYYLLNSGAATMRRDWKFWQYDPNGQGGQGKAYGVGSLGLDLNVFNGTVDDLREWLKMPIKEPLKCPYCGRELPSNYTVA